MTGRSPADHLIRRTRIAGWSAAGAASIATIGLIAGIGHTATSATANTTPATTTTVPATSTSNGTSTSGTGTSTKSQPGNVSTPDQGSQPHGGSNGS